MLPSQNGTQLLSSFYFCFWVFVEESVRKRFIDGCLCDSSCGILRRTTGKIFLTSQSFSLRVLPRPPKNEIDFVWLLSRFFCYSNLFCLFGLAWGKLRNGISTKVKIEHAGFYSGVEEKFFYPTLSLSGAKCKVSLTNYYSFWLVLVL